MSNTRKAKPNPTSLSQRSAPAVLSPFRKGGNNHIHKWRTITEEVETEEYVVKADAEEGEEVEPEVVMETATRKVCDAPNCYAGALPPTNLNRAARRNRARK